MDIVHTTQIERKMIMPKNKIKSLDDLLVELPLTRVGIVFTNGCFDIIHYGHMKYLSVAKTYGNVLVVAVNDDDSVKRLKGDSRPINSLAIRLFQLACLECVDYVTYFGEDTPYEMISKLKPDVLVKGGDYTIPEIVGHDIVEQTFPIQLVNGYSTTDLIARLKAS